MYYGKWLSSWLLRNSTWSICVSFEFWVSARHGQWRQCWPKKTNTSPGERTISKVSFIVISHGRFSGELTFENLYLREFGVTVRHVFVFVGQRCHHVVQRRQGLQWVAVCCSVLQCVAVSCSELQCVAVSCSVLQCVAVCCSALQCCNMLQRIVDILERQLASQLTKQNDYAADFWEFLRRLIFFLP